MDTAVLPEIQSEYDVWNVATVYWVEVDDWALVGSVERASGGWYKIALNQYPNAGPTYRQSAFEVKPPATRAPLAGYARRLAQAHGIEPPAWLEPSLREIVARLDADWLHGRGVGADR